MKMAWEEVPLGAQSGTVTFVVTDEMVDQHLAAAEMGTDWLPGAAAEDMRPGRGRIAPIDMISRLYGNDLMYKFHNAKIGQSVRAKQSSVFHSPARVGMEITATGHLKTKYEKRGRKFIGYELRFVDADGTLLLVDQRVLMVLDEGFQAKA
jgi:hypothetical protein